MKTKKLLGCVASVLAFLVVLFSSSAKLQASVSKNRNIDQITKNSPLILQHAFDKAAINLEHGSHSSHASHASHASHVSGS